MNESASSRIEKLENNEKKKKFIVASIIILLIAIFIGGMIWGINDVLLTEGTYPEPEGESVYALPQNGDEIVALYYRHFYDACLDSKKTKFSITNSLDIPEDSIKCEDGDEALTAVLKYVRESFTDALKESAYEDFEGKFGVDSNDKLIKPLFSANETTQCACYIGEVDDEGKPRLDDDGNIKNTQNYYLKFRFPENLLPRNEYNILYNNFDLGGVQEIIDSVIKANKDYFVVNSYTVTCSGFAIDADSNRFSGNLNYICYTRAYDIRAHITFVDECAAYGEHDVSFKINAKREYFFTWAGISLDSESLSLDKGETQQIKLYRTADEDIKVKWVSSNPEIATVDAEGYVKGEARSDKPVTITATAEYLGNTYTKTCEVYVVKPVEEVLVNPREVSLSVGKTAALTAKVSPKKATVKDVIWISLNEDVATVDEKGVVTAVGAGEAQVIAVTTIGRFKSTCTVTVK